MRSRPLFILTFLIAITTFYKCGSGNNDILSNSGNSRISISEEEDENSYSFVCKFSNNFSNEIRAIILKEYPKFDIEKNKSDVNVELQKKRLEMHYNFKKNSNTENLIKYKRIAEKIRSIDS